MPIKRLDKRTTLFIILGSIFLTNAILAELIGVKIFSLESIAGMEPAEIDLFENKYNFNLTTGVILWPVVFLTTDIINEYFGKDGVKKISFLTAGLIVYMFVIITVATALPPADFWLEINNKDPEGNFFDIDFAFTKIYKQGLGIIIGSLIAFLVGQFLDVFVFQFLRKRTGAKFIWLRATGSTLASQLVDSFIVLVVAFYIFGDWEFHMVISVGIVNYIYKFVIAVIMTPILYLAHNLIDRFLGQELANKMMDEASME